MKAVEPVGTIGIVPTATMILKPAKTGLADRFVIRKEKSCAPMT